MNLIDDNSMRFSIESRILLELDSESGFVMFRKTLELAAASRDLRTLLTVCKSNLFCLGVRLGSGGRRVVLFRASDGAAVVELDGRLNGASTVRPIVVVTTATGQAEPTSTP